MSEDRAARTDPPFCECGHCDSIGRNSGMTVTLPRAAWAVAGAGDLEALAVHPDHAFHYAGHRMEHHSGWVAVYDKEENDDAR